MALALVVPLFLISGSCGFVAPTAEECQLGASSHRFAPLFTGDEAGSAASQPELLQGTPSDPWKVVHPKKTSSQIIAAMKRHKIIPEIIQRVATDIQVCEVSYNDTVVNFGNVINYTFIQEHEPTHVKWPYKEGVLYTLIMSSPDAPGREEHNERELKMWLVGNIPENKIENGTSIADYVGMVPFYEEGHHRYIYLVYEQESASPIDFTNERHITSNIVSFKRAYHNTERYRDKYGLGPIAAINFFIMYYERKRYGDITSYVS